MESLRASLSALQADADLYSEPVQIWMKTMAISFLLSIVFIRSKPGARWILGALMVNIFGLIIGKMMFPEINRSIIGTGIHLLFWPIALWAIWRPSMRPSLSLWSQGIANRIYIVWLFWVSLLLSISLIFDASAIVRAFLTLL